MLRMSELSPDARHWLREASDQFQRQWFRTVAGAMQRNDPLGMHTTQDRRSVVTWRVADDGRISSVGVTVSSGIAYLDKLAIDSIRAALLDPPPAELVGRELPMTFVVDSQW